MNYYYLGKNNSPTGPVMLEEIRRLIEANELPADPIVVPVGGSQWQPLSQVVAAPSAAAPPAPKPPSQPSPYGAIFGIGLPFSPTILGDILVGKPFEWSRKLYPVSTMERSLKTSVTLAHIVALAGVTLGLLVGVIQSIRQNQIIPLIVTLILVLVAAVGQYLADKSLRASEELIQNTPHRVGSRGILHCISVLMYISALIFLLSGALSMLAATQLGVSWLTLLPGCILILLAWLSYAAGTLGQYPEILNISIGPVATGEEAVGILGFYLKTTLKVIPQIFLLLAAAGLLLSVVELFSPAPASSASSGQTEESYRQPTAYTNDFSPYSPYTRRPARLPVASATPATLDFDAAQGKGLAVVVAACMIPVLAYFWFLFANLGLEVIRAILIVPDRISALKKDPSTMNGA